MSPVLSTGQAQEVVAAARSHLAAGAPAIS
jgi:hypothetical protein